MLKYLKDRPETYGLPRPHEMFSQSDPATSGEEVKQTPAIERRVSFIDQLYVLKSPTVWIIALACALMYISRYAINSWAILFLQEAKGYSLVEAGAAMSFYPIAGLVGAVASGWLSDAFSIGIALSLPLFMLSLISVGWLSYSGDRIPSE